jgi:hypothetical protein
MKIRAAETIASLAGKNEGVPNFMNPAVHRKIAAAVRQAALRETGRAGKGEPGHPAPDRTGKGQGKGHDLHALPVPVSLPVPGIPENGAPDGLEVPPDLVETAGLENHLDLGDVSFPVPGNDLEVGPGLFSVQGKIDDAPAAGCGGPAGNLDAVAFFDGPLLEQPGQGGGGLLRVAQKDEAGGLPVEPGEGDTPPAHRGNAAPPAAPGNSGRPRETPGS